MTEKRYPGFLVRKTSCESCIYRDDNPLDLKRLENQVRDPHVGFRGHRICHHGGTEENQLCCRGFWLRHKDEFPLGQVAQRMDGVIETDDPESLLEV